MIVDAFTYFNETDALRIRLHELDDVVDWFVIVEASQTFTGKDKPLHFDSLPSWIDGFKAKIIRYIVDFPTDKNTAWDREFYQRNAINNALNSVPGLQKKDLIIISDADEIINKGIFNNTIELPIALNMRQYFWKLNWQVPDHCNGGARPVVTRAEILRHTTPQYLRSTLSEYVGPHGWHFSFLNAEKLGRAKIEAFAHTEVDKAEFKSLEAMSDKIERGIDPFDRFPLKYVNIDHTYPRWIQNHLNDVAHLIQPPLKEKVQ